MKFRLVIDPAEDEEIVAKVHERSALTDQIEALVMHHTGADAIVGFSEDDAKVLGFSDIECVTVVEGKTYAIDQNNERYRLKHRLYEVERILPECFVRINKSSLANEMRLERFSVSFNGAVDAVFQCGYREYVSRRCFAKIRRRFKTK